MEIHADLPMVKNFKHISSSPKYHSLTLLTLFREGESASAGITFMAGLNMVGQVLYSGNGNGKKQCGTELMNCYFVDSSQFYT